MRSTALGRMILVAAFLAVVTPARAQEATVSGTVTDTTGGVLPGVTVRAVHEASGNSFEAVTDARGVYRIPVRVGIYRMTAELSGFATLIRSGLELLVGQQATVNFQMMPSGLQESVTVTGEAPLIDVTQSSVGGNIDTRQMQELPVNGRNWVALTMLAPGMRGFAIGANDELLPRNTGTFQLNLDGQQVTNTIAFAHGQPHYSRDAIAEFEFISNRFDAGQGRSLGVQVNAITKSGTNTASGTLSAYFRDDRLNAADFIQRRVVPYSDQQVSATFGGPIRKDKVHFFLNYEYEREPQTFTYSSPFPRFNVDLSGIRRDHLGGARLDFEFQSQTRLMVRATRSIQELPFDPRYAGGAVRHPSAADSAPRHATSLQTKLTQVLGNRTVNEVSVGYNGFYWSRNSIPRWADSPNGKGTGAPQISLRGYLIGSAHQFDPIELGQDNYSARDDFSLVFNRGGPHHLKFGGEYNYHHTWVNICRNFGGSIDARGGPIPSNIEELFPVWNDVSTWNLAALSPITRSYSRGVGDCRTKSPRHVYAAWIQDDWAITPRLTLNLGLRYDLFDGVFAEDVALPPFLEAGRPVDTNNVGPRLGFAFTLTDRTVIRGGFGKYFGEFGDTSDFWTRIATQQLNIELLNDGRSDFAANPFNGPPPTYEEGVRSGATATASSLASPNAEIPYSYQTSIGVQRQLGNTVAVDVDYVFTGSRHASFSSNINLGYDPATGANYPFTQVSTRPYPNWGRVDMAFTRARSDYHALQAAFRKRFSGSWQASGTYTLSGLWDEDPPPMVAQRVSDTASLIVPVPFKVPPDLGGEWTLASTDMRHRAVFNGIWQLKYGFQLSGLYTFGSGMRFATSYGGDLRVTGGGGSGRLRPDGTIVPRNNFVGKPVHRVDLRVQRRFGLGGRAGVDGILEVFNAFNHANFGSYVTQEITRNYGAPSHDPNLAYQPRMLQLGLRFAF